MDHHARLTALLRYLRIAVTVLSLTACVLLVALWVRSYRKWDQLSIPFHADNWIAIESIRGEYCAWMFLSPDGATDGRWSVYTRSLEEVLANARRADPNYEFAPMRGLTVRDGTVWVPQWIAIAFATLLTVVPWMSRLNHFSLRTLLIATTLVAVGLGIVVYLAG